MDEYILEPARKIPVISDYDMIVAGGAEDRIVKTDYHDIPYRCLVPEKIENLLVAGRCISCTHIAEAAIRKVPVCMATGEAAGTAAALPLPHDRPESPDRCLQIQSKAYRLSYLAELCFRQGSDQRADFIL